MKKPPHPPLFLLALLGLSSCALPPREAWRVVQNDGLFPYIAVEMGKRPVPNYVHIADQDSSRFVSVTPSAKAPANASPKPGVYVVRRCLPLVESRYLASGSPSRPAVPVQAARPAPVIASASRLAPQAPITPAAKPAHEVASKPRVKATPKIETKPVPKIARHVDETVPEVRPKPPAVKKTTTDKLANVPRAKSMPEPTPAPAPKKTPAVAEKTAPPSTRPVPAPSPKGESAELPFGTPVPGRPGLVNSPFAGKLQIVDVTGLAPGQEVKCPYTGKLFRVPGGSQQAKNDTKPVETPPAGEKKSGADKKP